MSYVFGPASSASAFVAIVPGCGLGETAGRTDRQQYRLCCYVVVGIVEWTPGSSLLIPGRHADACVRCRGNFHGWPMVDLVLQEHAGLERQDKR